jgi:hypothetical protein
MSKRRAWRKRACGHKRRHMTVNSAQAHVAQLMAKDGELMVVYPCRWCGFFHVGHRGQSAG